MADIRDRDISARGSFDPRFDKPPARRQNPNTNQRKGNTSKGKNGEDKNSKSLRYPYEMLRDSTDYLKIEIADYIPPQNNLGDALGNIVDKIEVDAINSKGEQIKNKDGNVVKINPINQAFALDRGSDVNNFPKKKIKSTILLPIPQQLSDNTSVNWGDSTLSPLDAFGISSTAGIINKGLEGVGDVFDALRSTPDLLGNPQMTKAITAAVSGLAVGAAGGNVSGSQLVSRATGQVFNPNLELLFEGVNIRTFPFSFEFFPRNSKEALEVKKIIRTLKQSMSARKKGNNGGSIFISAPDVFKLTYMKGNNPHPFLNKFLPMALTSVNIVYTGSNTYSTFHDGTPTHMRMDLTFKELNPVYFEDYMSLEESGDQSVGY